MPGFDLPRRLVAEALGTALLVATVVGSGIMAESLTRDVGLALLGNTLPTGAMLVVLITMFGPEGQVWLDHLGPWRDVTVPGLSPDYPAVHCNRAQVCVLTTGMGHSNEKAKQLGDMAAQSVGYKSAVALAEARAKAMGTPQIVRQGATVLAKISRLA